MQFFRNDLSGPEVVSGKHSTANPQRMQLPDGFFSFRPDGVGNGKASGENSAARSINPAVSVAAAHPESFRDRNIMFLHELDIAEHPKHPIPRPLHSPAGDNSKIFHLCSRDRMLIFRFGHYRSGQRMRR